MKITKRQLRRIVREEAEKTVKYNANPALKGDQTKLPDELQKAIIDKEEDKVEEAIIRRIVREEKQRLLSEVDFVNYNSSRVRDQAYSKLEDLLMTNLPQFVDDLRAEEFATFEKVVMDAMAELKDRTVKNYSGEVVRAIKK